MIDSINKSIDSLQENILELEQGKADPGQVLDTLGLTNLKLPSAQVIALMDMLADGIAPINEDIISSLLTLCESYKKILYVLAGKLKYQAAELKKAPVPEAAEPKQETEQASKPTADKDKPAAAEPKQNETKGQGKAASITSIRVDTNRLDRLIEHVGKLMVTNAVISQAGLDNLNKVSGSLRELDITISDLQAEMNSIRLVPLKQIFTPMHRLVKSLSQKVNKKMEFEIIGDNLALDKFIVECLNEPLVHLLRNAVDHGLENAQDRKESGKDPVGHVTLSATRDAENAYILIKDDGHGLDAVKIRAKAEAKGLIAPDDELTDQEIYLLVLRSGVSTAAKVTSISGRGVGMDAVLNVIKNQLNGDISIQSELGKGSTFTLSIPLTRSSNEGIAEALVCRVGSEKFIIPSQDVVEIFIPAHADVVELPDGRKTVDVRGKIHSLIRLDELLDIESDIKDITQAQAVVVEVGEIRAAIVVSEVLRQQQVVVTKFTVPVEEIYNLPLLGYGMMGESDAMVLDTDALLQNIDTFTSKK